MDDSLAFLEDRVIGETCTLSEKRLRRREQPINEKRDTAGKNQGGAAEQLAKGVTQTGTDKRHVEKPTAKGIAQTMKDIRHVESQLPVLKVKRYRH